MLKAAMIRVLGLVAILLLVSRSAMSAPSCSAVVREVTPCLQFLKKDVYGVEDDQPSSACCSGVKDINDMAKSQPDRQAICDCIKKALSNVGSYDPTRIPLLPKKCGVPINLPPIDRNFDCSKVTFGGVIHVGS